MTYASRLRAVADQKGRPNWPNEKKVIPGWLIEKIWLEKLTGGFDCKKSNICQTCFVARSSAGSCNC